MCAPAWAEAGTHESHRLNRHSEKPGALPHQEGSAPISNPGTLKESMAESSVTGAPRPQAVSLLLAVDSSICWLTRSSCLSRNRACLSRASFESFTPV